MRELSEAAYLEAWQTIYKQQASWQPFDLAVAGGQRATNLAQVFIAGYQSAIRATFTRTSFAGWAAFVVSEDRSEQDPLPGVTAAADADGLLLSGHKSWIAAVDHVEELVVRAAGAAPGYYLVRRAAPGLVLQRNPAPSMLASLSQGRARFDNVRVSLTHKLDEDRVRHFAACEALFLYTAFAAYAGRLCAAAGDAAAVKLTQDLLGQAAALDPAADTEAMSALDDGVQRLRERLADTLFASEAGWQSDQRLIAMYSKNIQSRAG